MSDNSRPNLAHRILRQVPIIGYAVRCFEEERMGELALLGVNALMLVLLVTLLYGFPGFMTIMLIIVPLAGLLVVSTTLG